MTARSPKAMYTFEEPFTSPWPFCMVVTVIRKKICMVGAPGVGKTSLVRQFVYTTFSERYQSTVGVKIDRKEVEVDGTQVGLLLWDLEGSDRFQHVQGSYLRGSSGIVFVADGTRRDTLEWVLELRAQAEKEVGALPSVLALNKADSKDAWTVTPEDLTAAEAQQWYRLETSAKTGAGVEDAFLWLGRSMVAGGGR